MNLPGRASHHDCHAGVSPQQTAPTLVAAWLAKGGSGRFSAMSADMAMVEPVRDATRISALVREAKYA